MRKPTQWKLWRLIFLGLLVIAPSVQQGCAPAERVSRPPPQDLPPESSPMPNAVGSPLVGGQNVLGVENAVRQEFPVPPWQVWDAVSVRPESDPEMRAADEAVERGDLDGGVVLYRQLEQSAKNPRFREEAFVRRLGTMLKQGRSRAVLEEITQQVRAQGKKPEDVDASLGLIVAYSYLHLADNQQTLAWLGLTYRKVRGQGIFARRSMTEARRIIRGLPADRFDTDLQVWARDQVMSPLFQEEKARRASGGQPEPGQAPDWFRPALYSVDVYSGNLHETELNPSAASVAPSGGKAVVGVLLPTSGKYAAFAAQVKQGIDLALREPGRESLVRLSYADTAGEPETAAREFERLALREGAAIVLGPLLVKTAEYVAKKSEELQVPFITFTKRPGITDLSNLAFRLGATADDQAEELVTYTIDQLKLRRFAILYPRNNSSAEYVDAFRRAVSASAGELVAEAEFQTGDGASAEKAIESMFLKSPEAIFIPDSLDGLFPVLDALRRSQLKDRIVLGPALWNDPIASRGFGQLLDAAVFVTPFFMNSTRPKVAEFVAKYRQAYGKEPELLAAQGYDAAELVFSSIVDPAASRQSLVEKLRSVSDREGVTGALTVRPNGEVKRRMSVVRVKAGELEEVASVGDSVGFRDEKQEQEKVQ